MRPSFFLSRSPITVRPLFPFYLGRSLITMRPLHIFHLGRSPMTIRLFQKSLNFIKKKNLHVFPLSALSSPHFKYFQKNSSFLDMVSLLSFPFSSLQGLLSKISYEIFYRKHCKEGGNCHNLFLGYSSNSLFLFQKI